MTVAASALYREAALSIRQALLDLPSIVGDEWYRDVRDGQGEDRWEAFHSKNNLVEQARWSVRFRCRSLTLQG
jgi:hypothetical protein